MAFNVWTFLFEMVNFVVLAYILHRLLYRPLRAAIDNRHAKLVQTQTEAESARAQALAAEQQLQSQLADLEKTKQMAMQEARQSAAKERQRLLTEAEHEIDKRRAEGQASIERMHTDALKSLRSEITVEATKLAERLLHEAAGTALQPQLAERLIDALVQLPPDERTRVRRGWKESDGAVLETAAPLDKAYLKKLSDAVSSVVGQNISLAVETKPALLAGARIRIGGHVWDASLAGQLETTATGEAERLPHA